MLIFAWRVGLACPDFGPPAWFCQELCILLTRYGSGICPNFLAAGRPGLCPEFLPEPGCRTVPWNPPQMGTWQQSFGISGMMARKVSPPWSCLEGELVPIFEMCCGMWGPGSPQGLGSARLAYLPHALTWHPLFMTDGGRHNPKHALTEPTSAHPLLGRSVLECAAEVGFGQRWTESNQTGNIWVGGSGGAEAIYQTIYPKQHKPKIGYKLHQYGLKHALHILDGHFG